MREKMPKRRGHRVTLLGLMVVKEMTELSDTNKSMKERCQQLCTKEGEESELWAKQVKKVRGVQL